MNDPDYRNYELDEDVVAFDAEGLGPSFERLQVTANAERSPYYPECRISVHLGKLATGGLTPAQSAELRALLERAEIDVLSSVPSLHPGPEPMPPLTVATGEARCESCCLPIGIGEPVHVYEGAVVHAGPCPDAGELRERTFQADELVRSTVEHHAWICTDRGCATRLVLQHGDPRLGSGRAPKCERCGALTCPVNPDTVPARSN